MRLCLVFLLCAAAALLLAILQCTDGALVRRHVPMAAGPTNTATARSASTDRPPIPRTAFAPTFAEAAEALRAGHHVEAYGRFVALAHKGDVDAARIALVMHRFGPDLFGSTWDASVEQLEEWTRWSPAAAQKERDDLRTLDSLAGDATGARGGNLRSTANTASN